MRERAPQRALGVDRPAVEQRDQREREAARARPGGSSRSRRSRPRSSARSASVVATCGRSSTAADQRADGQRADVAVGADGGAAGCTIVARATSSASGRARQQQREGEQRERDDLELDGVRARARRARRGRRSSPRRRRRRRRARAAAAGSSRGTASRPPGRPARVLVGEREQPQRLVARQRAAARGQHARGQQTGPRGQQVARQRADPVLDRGRAAGAREREMVRLDQLRDRPGRRRPPRTARPRPRSARARGTSAAARRCRPVGRARVPVSALARTRRTAPGSGTTRPPRRARRGTGSPARPARAAASAPGVLEHVVAQVRGQAGEDRGPQHEVAQLVVEPGHAPRSRGSVRRRGGGR